MAAISKTGVQVNAFATGQNKGAQNNNNNSGIEEEETVKRNCLEYFCICLMAVCFRGCL